MLKHFPLLIAAAALTGLASDRARSECAQLPDEEVNLETALTDKIPFASEGVIWSGANKDKTFDPTIEWESDTPTQSIHFVMIDDATGAPISTWPYFLGRGLYVGLTGTFTATVSSNDFSSFSVSKTYSTPMQAAEVTPHGPSLFSVTLPQPTSKANFKFSSQGFSIYLICPSGNCDYAQPFIFPKRIRLVANLNEETTYDGNNGLVCSEKPITITSHCTLSATPMNITFRDLTVNGTVGVLEETKTTEVTVTCRSGADVSQKPANIRIYPEHIDDGDPALARFTGRDGQIFHGIALVYNLNDRPACTGSDSRLEWNTSQTLGEWEASGTDQTSSGTVYWGLCRIQDSRRDTGEYGTTATISFWVD